MSQEDTTRTDRTPTDHRLLLSGLRDEALLLTLAVDYMCEKPYLERIGFAVTQKVQELDLFVEGLKKRFVGIPTKEMDVEEHFSLLRQVAERLQDPDEEVCEECAAGRLGRKLDEGVDQIAAAIERLRDRVEGRDVSYTAADTVLGVFGKFRALFQAMAGPYRLALRIMGVLFFAFLVAFGYLWATMPGPAEWAQRIEQIEAEVSALERKHANLGKDLGVLEQKYDQLAARKDLTRQETLDILELNVKMHKLQDQAEKVQAELNLKRRALEEDRARLEKLEQKTFLQRLLRQ